MGQYDLDECQYVKSVTGNFPVIRGIDFMNHSPRFVQYAGRPSDDEIESYIRDARNDKFVYTASWHWSPSINGVDNNNYYNAFYKMDLDPLSNMEAIVNDMDAIAECLKKFKDASVPVIWRPLHEVSRWGWFWWSKDAHTFNTLYRTMYDRYKYRHGLDNLVWCWNPAHNYDFNDASFYPGDDVVDIAAIDYPSDLSGAYNGMKNMSRDKVYAVAEFAMNDGQRYLDSFESAPWAYMVAWSRDQGPQRAGWDVTKRLYEHRYAKSHPWP